MAQFRVLQKSFINNTIVEEGEIIEFDGEAGPNLEAVKPAKGKKVTEEAPTENAGGLV